MNKNLFIAFVLICVSIPSFSQNFTREAGIRGGQTAGFTYRQYLDEYLSYEGILSFRKSGIQFTLLRQVHEINPLYNVDQNFRFIYGYGAHVGYYFSEKYKPFGFTEIYFPARSFSPVLGVNGYAAVEYRLDSFPIVIGLDYKPFFEFSIYQYFNLSLWDFAFTARYRF